MRPSEASYGRNPELAEVAESSMGPPRILLAEDDLELRRMLADLLEAEGYCVVQVEDGSALLEALTTQLLEKDESEGFDLVITDVRMPGQSGLDVLDRLRSCDWQTQFLLITAFGDEATHAEAYRLGSVVLDKPFHLNDLLGHVRALVAPGRYREGWSGARRPRQSGRCR